MLEKCNEADFSARLTKLYVRMAELEIGKDCPPKFTKAVRGLTKFLGIELDQEQLIQSYNERIARREVQESHN